MATGDIFSEFNACIFREQYRDARTRIDELVYDRDRYRDALSKIVWIKDCGIDSVAPSSSLGDYDRLTNHPDEERDKMYEIAKAALASREDS